MNKIFIQKKEKEKYSSKYSSKLIHVSWGNFGLISSWQKPVLKACLKLFCYLECVDKQVWFLLESRNALEVQGKKKYLFVLCQGKSEVASRTCLKGWVKIFY